MAAGFDVSQLSQGASGFVSGTVNIVTQVGFFALIAAVVFVVLLYYFRWRKLVYTAIVIRDIGQKKPILDILKAGKFKTNKILKGLIDWSGPIRGYLADGREILGFGDKSLFPTASGKMAILCEQKSDDPKIVVAMEGARIENGELITAIAPVEFQDAAKRNLEKAEAEQMSNLEKWVPLIMQIGTIVLLIFIVVFGLQWLGTQNDKILKVLSDALAAHPGSITLPSTAP